MKLFKDIITGDDLFSDVYPMKLVDDLYYEVEGKTMTERTELDDKLFGGNASAEGGGEDDGADASESTGINIVMTNRLVSTPAYTAKTYKVYIKAYMKKILEQIKDEARAETFKKGMPAVVKKIMERISSYDFYTGESMNPEGMAVPMDYREDGITPYFIFFKDGMVEEKL